MCCEWVKNILAGFNLHGVDIGVCCHDAPDDIVTERCPEYVRMEAVNNLILLECLYISLCTTVVWLALFFLSFFLTSFAHHAFFHNSTQANSIHSPTIHLTVDKRIIRIFYHTVHFSDQCHNQLNQLLMAAWNQFKSSWCFSVRKTASVLPCVISGLEKKIAWRLAHNRLNKSWQLLEAEGFFSYQLATNKRLLNLGDLQSPFHMFDTGYQYETSHFSRSHQGGSFGQNYSSTHIFSARFFDLNRWSCCWQVQSCSPVCERRIPGEQGTHHWRLGVFFFFFFWLQSSFFYFGPDLHGLFWSLFSHFSLAQASSLMSTYPLYWTHGSYSAYPYWSADTFVDVLSVFLLLLLTMSLLFRCANPN